VFGFKRFLNLLKSFFKFEFLFKFFYWEIKNPFGFQQFFHVFKKSFFKFEFIFKFFEWEIKNPLGFQQFFQVS